MITQETYIELLRAAIQLKHCCKALHVESVPITAQMNDRTVWDGVVEVFELKKHKQAHWCYGWIEKPNGMEQRFVIILQKGLIITPQHAVHGWLASKPVTVSPVLDPTWMERQVQQIPHYGSASYGNADANARPSSHESN